MLPLTMSDCPDITNKTYTEPKPAYFSVPEATRRSSHHGAAPRPLSQDTVTGESRHETTAISVSEATRRSSYHGTTLRPASQDSASVESRRETAAADTVHIGAVMPQEGREEPVLCIDNDNNRDHSNDSLTLIAAMDDGCLREIHGQDDPLGLSGVTAHSVSKLSRTSSGSAAVKNASKKVWKSVKRRFGGRSDEPSASHAVADYGTMPPPCSPQQMGSNSSRRNHAGSSCEQGDEDSGSTIVHDNALNGRLRRMPNMERSSRDLSSSGTRIGSTRLSLTTETAGGADTTTTGPIVGSAETALRHVMALLMAALFGAKFHYRVCILEKVIEYVLVAWLTCLTLRLALVYQGRQQLRPQDTVDWDEKKPLLQDREIYHSVRQQVAELIVVDSREVETSDDVLNGAASSKKPQLSKRALSLDESSSGRPLIALLQPEPTGRSPQTVVHPALNPYYVIDTAACARVFPNATRNPFPLDTDYFKGYMLVLIRTPDTDNVQDVKGTSENEAAVTYFRDKQRRFEFQFQVKLKKIPTGRVYFACELTETLKMGMIQRAFVSAAMAFVKSTNPNFHYSLSGTPESPDGRWECPHMAFPVEEGMNRVITTPPGEQPPDLGEELFESDSSLKRRKKGLQVEWNMQDIYTFSLWSAYVDFLDWRCLNLPGIRPFSLSNVIGSQPIILALYELLPENKGSDTDQSKHHYRCNTINIVRLEMCNSIKSGIGPGTRKWLSDHRDYSPVESTAIAFSAKKRSRDEEADEEADEEDVDSADESSDSGDEEQETTDPVEDCVECDRTIISEAFAEELGEGIYVRSGDAISLRESFLDDENQMRSFGPCYVANGGGFAVLQEQKPCVVIIEKAGSSRLRKSAVSSSRLIKSGDTVVFKIRGKGRPDDVEVRYLTIHRGWWLKWVSVFPKKNGFFTVHTHETEFADRGRSAETQSTYLTLGGSFWLRHKRWSKYHVGFSSEASATYGGRMLGLHIPPKDGDGSNIGDGNFHYPSDDGMDAVYLDGATTEKEKGEWMRPLQLQAYESSTLNHSTQLKIASEDRTINETKSTRKLAFSLEKHNIDVPAFVEILNRVDRILQHAYVVRVLPPEPLIVTPIDDISTDKFSQDEKKSHPSTFVRLRTGRDLAQVMRVGLKWRNNLATPSRGTLSTVEDSTLVRSVDSPPTSMRQRAYSSPVAFAKATDLIDTSARSIDSADDLSFKENDSESTDGEWGPDSVEELESVGSDDDVMDPSTLPSLKRHGKGRNLIGKFAKSMKTKTTAAAKTTTKKVVSQGVRVGLGTVNAGKATVHAGVKVGLGTVNAGKATVNAGKAILPIRPKKPPMKEPKSAKRHTRRLRATGLHVDVNAKSMRRVELIESHLYNSVLAGELSAPEQSCRTVSSMLSKMSSQPETSDVLDSFSNLLSTLVETTSELDDCFLLGGAVQVGVSQTKVDSRNGPLLFDSLVARCLWESHWREEWCGLYKKGLVFHAPLTTSPCLELSFSDIKSVRFLSAGAMNPLAGYPLLVIETAWLCHYCAFANNRARQTFYGKIEDVRAIAAGLDETSVTSSREKELAEARFWQGFQTAIQYSQSFGRGKWANVSSGGKMKSRAVLNNRRMVFDLHLPSNDDDVDGFVQELLSTALSFSLDSLKQNPEALIRFLDKTSQLRTVPLQDVDLASPKAYCLFVNIYHCLLQHALLFSVNGPLHRRSFDHFMRTSCYEIGGDVFSLAELYSCVIRGNMSRPLSSRPPYMDAPKKSNAYRFYALGFTNPNTNFLLNTADVSCPRAVPVLNIIDLDRLMESQAAAFIRKSVAVDVARKQVILPKIFDVYRNDYASDFVHPGSGYESLRYCLRYLDDSVAFQTRMLLNDNAVVIIIKYHPAAEQFHSSIKRKTLEEYESSEKP